jgi:hypothetical protein
VAGRRENLDWVVLAENAMEPCSDADNGLIDIDAISESRRFNSH